MVTGDVAADCSRRGDRDHESGRRRVRVAAVIVNFRTAQLVCNALASLEEELCGSRDLAIVVDNASGDGSAEKIRTWAESRGAASWVRVVDAEQNRGFAAGNNRAFREVDAEFLLLLNSDARLAPGALAALLEAANAHPRAGAIGVALEGPDGAPHSSCFRYPSPASELIAAAATGPVTRLLRRWDVPLPPSDRASSPDWTSFACVLLRGAAVDAAGPMDEGYFLYYEDVDYCRRIREAGWDVRCEPRARAIHDHGGSSPVPGRIRERARLPDYLYRSRARYFRRYYGRLGFWLANWLWWLGRGVSLARELVGHKSPHVCDAAWRDIWLSDPDPSARPRAGQGRA